MELVSSELEQCSEESFVFIHLFYHPFSVIRTLVLIIGSKLHFVAPKWATREKKLKIFSWDAASLGSNSAR